MAYDVYYWTACKDFWGRAIGVVLTLDEAGAQYQIHLPEKAPPNIGFMYPCITLASGQSIGQTPAILSALGDTFGLNGETPEQRIACQARVLELDDIFSEALSGKFKDKPERADQWFSLLEQYLGQHKFMVSDTPTVADFHGVFAFEWVHKRYSETGYAKFPRLTQWWQDICAHDVVYKMKHSGIAMIP